MAIGIQIMPTFRARSALGYYVGATTIVVLVRVFLNSNTAVGMLVATTPSAHRLSLKPIAHSFALDKSLIQI